MDLAFFATAPRGVERALASELRALGAAHVREARGGASFEGPLETGYRACLWSRLATRVLLGLARFPAASADQLYAGVQTVDWRDHLGPDATLAVSFTGTSDTIRDTRFGALKTKDAIVDQLRAATGSRPSVDTRRPDVRVNVHLEGGRADLALDLSGESLHRRGYRAERVQVEAPLKENLAAAVLALAGWPAVAERDGSFVDGPGDRQSLASPLSLDQSDDHLAGVQPGELFIISGLTTAGRGLPGFGCWRRITPGFPAWGSATVWRLDGISQLLLLLTAFINILCTLVSWRAITTKIGSFHFFLLFLESSVMGLFMATDLLLFYLFWEIQIIPMFFLVGLWGHERRVYAAVSLFCSPYAAVCRCSSPWWPSMCSMGNRRESIPFLWCS